MAGGYLPRGADMIEPRDESLAGPPKSGRELLGPQAAYARPFLEGDIYGRCGQWTDKEWDAPPCTCGAPELAANHQVGELDFTDGELPGPDGCACHLGGEEYSDWYTVPGEQPEAQPYWSVAAIDDFPEEALAGTRYWGADGLEREVWDASGRPAEAHQPATIDIYFSAGQRKNWNRIGYDITNPERVDPGKIGYRSCDDGNDRSCEIWRVRWNFAKGLATATAEKVFGREEFGVEDWYPMSFTRPAVSPDGRFLAYAWREWTSRNTFHDQGRFAVRVREIGGSILTDHDVAWPLPWGGGVGWPAWLDDEALVVANEMLLQWGDKYTAADGKDRVWRGFDASFKTVQQVPLSEESDGKHADGNAFPIRGPGVRYASLDFVPNRSESNAIQEMRVATDPHAHADAKYGSHDRRGPRVASFGNLHDESEAATTEVFDPTLEDPFGELGETFRKPTETYDTDETTAGLHHPTWNITGDMVQVSHQETQVKITDWLTRRGLYGFRWSATEERWVPWNDMAGVGNQGRLFPNGGWDETYDSDAWWTGLPATLQASSEGMPTLPNPVVSAATAAEERCSMYVWKYGAFCGSDDYVVAQFACINPTWATTLFSSEIALSADPDATGPAVEHLAQLMSRVVLIRLSDGHHWDLTSLVEDAIFGSGPRPPGFQIFGLYPTCGALVGRVDD